VGRLMDLWWVTTAVFAVMIPLVLWMSFGEAKGREEYATRQRAAWRGILKSHDGDRTQAAIDYRAQYGEWPGDWNRP